MSRSGRTHILTSICNFEVLIPLLVDVPLWEVMNNLKSMGTMVLIPLLVDVPLWDLIASLKNIFTSLNPSFSGCPALGL